MQRRETHLSFVTENSNGEQWEKSAEEVEFQLLLHIWEISKLEKGSWTRFHLTSLFINVF